MNKTSDLFTKSFFLKSLKLILILALLAGFFYYVPLSKIMDVVKTASLPPLVWALAVSLLAVYIASLQLWILTRKQGITIPPHRLFWINLSVRFYSFFSPVSTVGSLLRWQRLAIDGKSAEGLAAIAANRILDIFVAVAVGLFWALAAFNRNLVNVPLTAAYLMVFLLALWLLMRISSLLAVWAERKSAGSRQLFVSKGFHLLEKLFLSFAMYRSFSWSDLFLLTFTAAISQLITLLAYVFIGLSLHVSISIADLGWMRALLFLASLAPFTLAGGFGLREVSTVVIMAGMGIAPGEAAAFSLLIYARSVVISLVGGGVELVLFLFQRSPRQP